MPTADQPIGQINSVQNKLALNDPASGDLSDAKPFEEDILTSKIFILVLILLISILFYKNSGGRLNSGEEGRNLDLNIILPASLKCENQKMLIQASITL